MEAPPAASEEPNNLDTLPAFAAEKWIGTGKTFSFSQSPLHVLQEKHNQLMIPDGHLIHFPATDLPVTIFIELSLPKQSTEIITTATKIWFSKDIPCTER